MSKEKIVEVLQITLIRAGSFIFLVIFYMYLRFFLLAGYSDHSLYYLAEQRPLIFIFFFFFGFGLLFYNFLTHERSLSRTLSSYKTVEKTINAAHRARRVIFRTEAAKNLLMTFLTGGINRLISGDPGLKGAEKIYKFRWSSSFFEKIYDKYVQKQFDSFLKRVIVYFIQLSLFKIGFTVTGFLLNRIIIV